MNTQVRQKHSRSVSTPFAYLVLLLTAGPLLLFLASFFYGASPLNSHAQIVTGPYPSSTPIPGNCVCRDGTDIYGNKVNLAVGQGAIYGQGGACYFCNGTSQTTCQWTQDGSKSRCSSLPIPKITKMPYASPTKSNDKRPEEPLKLCYMAYPDCRIITAVQCPAGTDNSAGNILRCQSSIGDTPKLKPLNATCVYSGECVTYYCAPELVSGKTVCSLRTNGLWCADPSMCKSGYCSSNQECQNRP